VAKSAEMAKSKISKINGEAMVIWRREHHDQRNNERRKAENESGESVKIMAAAEMKPKCGVSGV